MQIRIYRTKYVIGSVRSENINNKKIKKSGATLFQAQMYSFMSSKAQSSSRDSPLKYQFIIATLILA